MAVDLRQVMAAFLTFSMFLMLGNMIKRDHIDPLLEAYPESRIVQYNSLKVSKLGGTFKLSEINNGLWKTNNEAAMQPCWKKKPSFTEEGKRSNHGYIFFSLSSAPEYHASQVANAVAVARQLGARLAIPDIIGSKSGHKMSRRLGEIYDVDTFVTSLKGIVGVDKNPPAELSNGKLPVVRVPNGVSKDFIASKVNPIFHSKRNLKIFTYFNSSKETSEEECMTTFESLKLQPDLQQLVDSIVRTLKSLSQTIRGYYIAVDLNVDRFCKASKHCYNAEEIGKFLTKMGVEKETTIYVTQTGWSSSLDGLRNIFPNTFTKDAIMAIDQKAMFMEYKKIIDLYVCMESDVFVPSVPGKFYSDVVGRRIGEGRTQVLIPANKTSAAPIDYVPPVIAKKTHFAYSCFC